MKSNHQIRIEQFMRMAGQEVPKSPTIPSLDIRLLRASLILEEALETIEALGFKLAPENIGLLATGQEPDLEKIADGCADLSVVTVGTLSACGIQDGRLLEEVDVANLRKFEEGAYKREDGKWMKPPNWQPPNIRKAIYDQR